MIRSSPTTPQVDPCVLAGQLDVPVLAGLQHQGDLSVVPAAMAEGFRVPRAAVPAAGIPVLRDGPDANTHLLLAAGGVSFEPREATAKHLAVGYLLVTATAEAYLLHPEHGACGIAAGRYVLRRKREYSERVRLVLD